MPEDNDVVYPVVVFTSRYQGAYEGATWIALNEHVDDQRISDVQADDISCAHFFADYPYPVGRGSNPCAAYADLRLKLIQNPEQAWPNR